MPISKPGGGGGGGGRGGGGILYITRAMFDALGAEDAIGSATYGVLEADGSATLWRVEVLPEEAVFGGFADPNYLGANRGINNLGFPTSDDNYVFNTANFWFYVRDTTGQSFWTFLSNRGGNIDAFLPAGYDWAVGSGAQGTLQIDENTDIEARGAFANDEAFLPWVRANGFTAGTSLLFFNREVGEVRALTNYSPMTVVWRSVSAGVTYVTRAVFDALSPNIIGEHVTYGVTEADGSVSLWRIALTIDNIIDDTFDDPPRYKGVHVVSPSLPTNARDYYYISSASGNVRKWVFTDDPPGAWLTSLFGDVNPYFNEAADVWPFGSSNQAGVFPDTDAVIDYLDDNPQAVGAHVVYFNSTLNEPRRLSSWTRGGRQYWQAVSAGDGPVPGPRGTSGTDGEDYDPAEIEAIRDGAVDARDAAQAAQTAAEEAEADALLSRQAAGNAAFSATSANANVAVLETRTQVAEAGAQEARTQAVAAQDAAQGFRDTTQTISGEAEGARDQARTARDEAEEAQAAAEAAAAAAAAQSGHQEAIQSYIEAGTQTNITVELTNDGELNMNAQGGVTPPSDHTRVAIVSPDANFNASEIAAGTTSMTSEITLPTWNAGTRYLLFLQPVDEDEYTDMRPQGSPFNNRASFDIQGATLQYNGSTHRAYLYDDQLLQRSSGEVWELM